MEGRLLFDLSHASDAFLVDEQVVSPNSGLVQHGDVAMDADGEFAFGWELWYAPKLPGDLPDYVPMLRMFARPGIGVGPDIEVHDRADVEAGPGPRIAATRDGDFLLAWQLQGAGVVGRDYHGDGNPIGPSYPLPGAGGTFALAMNPSGQFVVAWANGGGLYAQRFDRGGGTVGGVTRLNRTVGAASRSDLALAMDQSGGFVAVWRQELAGTVSLMSRRFYADGREQYKESVVVSDPSIARGVAVGADAEGDFVVVWADGQGVRGRLGWTGGAPRSVPFVIEPGAVAGSADVAVAADGKFLVSWRAGINVYARQYTAAGGAGQTVAVAQAAGVVDLSTALSMDGGGTRAVVGWHDWQRKEDLRDYSQLHGRLLDVTEPGSGPGPEPGPPPPPPPAGNQPPTTSGIADVAVDQDAPDTVIPLFESFSDAEDGDGAMHYGLAGNTNVPLFSAVLIDDVTGMMTLDYAPGASGEAAVTLRATDRTGASVETAFKVTVRATTPLPGPGPGPGPGPDVPTFNPGSVGSPPTALGDKSFGGRLIAKAPRRKPAGLAGVGVFLDSNLNGTLDAGEVSATTDALGNYAFTGLAAGKYRVRMDLPEGYMLTGKRHNGGLRDVLLRAKQRKPAKAKPVVLKPLA